MFRAAIVFMALVGMLPAKAQNSAPGTTVSPGAGRSGTGIPSLALNRYQAGDKILPDSIMAQRALTLAGLLQGQLPGVRAFNADGDVWTQSGGVNDGYPTIKGVPAVTYP